MRPSVIKKKLKDGKVNWQVELVENLEGKVPGWGYTESVLVDGRFRLNHNPSAFRWWSGLV